MVKAFPLNQQEYSYNAQDVMKYYVGRNSGVFETGDNLKVSVNSGLEVNVNSGVGWLSKDYVASVVFWNESPMALSVEAGDDTYNRIDLVVVSWNFPNQDKNPEIVIRKGTPSANPSVPSLVNDNSTIEIALAKINVAKGTVSLAESNIVDLRGDSTYCPMVYAEKTIKNTFNGCVGYADGVNKISDFPSITPSSSDKILIEQGGEGKSATLADIPISTKVQSVLDTKINKTDSLTYEEIMATTDLTNKVPSANALKTLDANKFSIIYKQYEWKATHTFKVNTRSIGLIYTDDGTLYNYILWNLSSLSLIPISGNNTLTATVDSGNITISMATARALFVVGC